MSNTSKSNAVFSKASFRQYPKIEVQPPTELLSPAFKQSLTSPLTSEFVRLEHRLPTHETKHDASLSRILTFSPIKQEDVKKKALAKKK